MKKTMLVIFCLFAFFTGHSQWVRSNDNINNEAGSLYSWGDFLVCVQPGSGVFVSANQGATWYDRNNGLPTPLHINGFTFANENMVLSLDDYTGNTKVYMSNDLGYNWSLQSVFVNELTNGLYYDGSVLYAGGGNTPMYTSHDNGLTWVVSGNGIENPYFRISGFCQAPGSVFIFSSEEIYKTTDQGAHWVKIQTGITLPNPYTCMLSFDGKILLAVDNQNYLVSNNDGVTWNEIQGIPITSVTDLQYIAGHVLAATTTNGIYELVNGSNWVYLNFENKGILSIIALGNNMFASEMYNGIIYRSSDMFSTFEQTNNGMSSDFRVFVENINARLFSVATSPGFLFYSDNDGQSWNKIPGNNANGDVISIGHKEMFLLMGTTWTCWSLTNPEFTWLEKNPFGGSPTPYYDFFNLNSATYFAGDKGIYLSTDGNLAVWEDLNADLSTHIGPYLFIQHVFEVDTLNGSLFIGTDKGIYRSDNSGHNWTSVFAAENVTKLVSVNNNLIAETANGMVISNDSGSTWNPYISNLPDNLRVNTFFIHDHTLFIGSIDSGVFKSVDGGMSWTFIGEGIEGLTVNSFTVLNGFIYIGTSNGAWKRPITELSVQNANTHTDKILLSPNPANDRIFVEVRSGTAYKKALVTLINLHGKEVLKLETGETRFMIDLSHLIKGMYFIRVEYNETSQIRKIIKE